MRKTDADWRVDRRIICDDGWGDRPDLEVKMKNRVEDKGNVEEERSKPSSSLSRLAEENKAKWSGNRTYKHYNILYHLIVKQLYYRLDSGHLTFHPKGSEHLFYQNALKHRNSFLL